MPVKAGLAACFRSCKCGSKQQKYGGAGLSRNAVILLTLQVFFCFTRLTTVLAGSMNHGAPQEYMGRSSEQSQSRMRSGHAESIIPTVFPKSFTRLCLLPATEPRQGTLDGSHARNTGRIRRTVTSLPGSGIRAGSIGIAVGNAKALRLLFAFLCLHRWVQGFAKPKTQRKPNHRKALPDWGVDYAHKRFHPFGCTQRPSFTL